MKPEYIHSPLEFTEEFQADLVQWYRKHAEAYPWRQTTDPYEILVSEVMLQQTTVQAVIENKRYEQFLSTFPDVETLAEAEEVEILRAWEGLGYYNRVRNLQKAARALREHHEGEFPRNLSELQALPGIGPYTAAAVASFCFNHPAPLVDANVARVLSRIFQEETPVNTSAGEAVAWERAGKLVSQENAREYNGAIMELGQKICRVREVHCERCPVSGYCATRDPLTLPKKKAKQKVIPLTEHVGWALTQKGELFLQKAEGTRRKGMWVLPPITEEEAALSSLLHESKYQITKYRVTLKVYATDPPLGEKGQWVSLGELTSLPMPSPYRRVVEALLAHHL